MGRPKTPLERLKEEIGYTRDNSPMCQNCAHFSMRSERKEGHFGYYIKEYLRCAKHSFATLKRGYCQGWERKK